MIRGLPRLRRLTTALGALFCASAAHALEIDLQPTTIEVPSEPGGRIQQVFTVSNRGGEDATGLTIGLADWTLAQDGDLKLLPPGSEASSASDWIVFSPVFIELGPGQTRRILVDIAVPQDAAPRGTYRAALLASAVEPDRRAGAEGTLRKHQIASLLYLTGPEAHSQPLVQGVEAVRLPDGKPALALRVENTGSAHARLEGNIRIQGSGEPVEFPVSNLVVLPDSVRTFTVPLAPPLPDRASATISFRNIFAPQAPGNTELLPVYTAPLPFPADTPARR